MASQLSPRQHWTKRLFNEYFSNATDLTLWSREADKSAGPSRGRGVAGVKDEYSMRAKPQSC